jgi:tetratricopeptide (TPR) repeat protein
MRYRHVTLALLLWASATPALTAIRNDTKPAAASNDAKLLAEGNVQLDAGHYDESIQIFTDLLVRNPRNGVALANRAFAYGWTNRLDEAERDLQAAAAIIPDDARIDRIRGLIAIRRSDDEQALIHLSKSIEKEPGNWFALRFRSDIYRRAGNDAAALADLDAYATAQPDDADAYFFKADLFATLKKRDLAFGEADQMLIRFSDSAFGIATAARIYDRLGDRERALGTIAKAIELDPDNFDYRRLRAKFRRWDDFSGRRDDLNVALKADPNDADILTEIGLLEFRQHRWREAADRFSDVLALEPKDFGLLAYRAMAHLQEGNGQAATKDYNAALSSSSGANDLSLVCWALGRDGLALQWALEACNRAAALQDLDTIRANRGLVLMRLGQLEAALDDFNVAIETDDSQAESFYGRALVHQRLADQESARKDVSHALAINPRIAEEYQQYGFENPAQASFR